VLTAGWGGVKKNEAADSYFLWSVFQLVSVIEFFKIANKYGYLIINDSFSFDKYLWAPKFNI